MKRLSLICLSLALLTGCGAHVKMPVYRSLVTDRAPSQFSFILEDVTVKGTLYEQDVVILDGDTQTKMKPSASEWLRDAILTEFDMAGLVEGSKAHGKPSTCESRGRAVLRRASPQYLHLCQFCRPRRDYNLKGDRHFSGWCRRLRPTLRRPCGRDQPDALHLPPSSSQSSTT